MLVTGLPPTDMAIRASSEASLPLLPLGLVLMVILTAIFGRRLQLRRDGPSPASPANGSEYPVR